MNIGWKVSWSKRKEFGVDSCQKYKRSYTKIYGARIEDKNMCPPSQKPGTASANMWHGRATLQDVLLLLLLRT